MRATRVSSRASVNKSTARCEESGFAHEFSDTWTRNTHDIAAPPKSGGPRGLFFARADELAEVSCGSSSLDPSRISRPCRFPPP